MLFRALPRTAYPCAGYLPFTRPSRLIFSRRHGLPIVWPMRLLRACQKVERALGRRRGVARGPRPIDIDILLYENIVVRSLELSIPHPRMEERRFVLIPLGELAPSLHHPVSQRTVLEMLRNTPDMSQVVRMHL